jgi:hypothetical protein
MCVQKVSRNEPYSAGKTFTHVKQTVKRRDQLLNLQHSQIPTHAHTATTTKDKVNGILHASRTSLKFLGALILALKPAVRIGVIRIIPKDTRVPVSHEGIAANLSTSGNLPSIGQRETILGGYTLNDHSDTGAHAYRLADNYIQIR